MVRHGDYKEHFAWSSKVYCYSRKTQDESLLVVCSFSEKNTAMRVPKGFDLSQAKLLLQNYPDATGDTLRPYECRVYHWQR